MTRRLASAPTAALDHAVVAALAASGPMTVRDLRAHLRVRRQSLLQTMARLKAVGAVKAEPRRAKTTDKKIRTVLVYALVLRPSEPGSLGLEPGSHAQNQSVPGRHVVPGVVRRRQCIGCNTIWIGSGGPWCPDCVPVERPRP